MKLSKNILIVFHRHSSQLFSLICGIFNIFVNSIECLENSTNSNEIQRNNV